MKQYDDFCDRICVSKIDSQPGIMFIIGGHECGHVIIDSQVGGVRIMPVVAA